MTADLLDTKDTKFAFANNYPFPSAFSTCHAGYYENFEMDVTEDDINILVDKTLSETLKKLNILGRKCFETYVAFSKNI